MSTSRKNTPSTMSWDLDADGRDMLLDFVQGIEPGDTVTITRSGGHTRTGIAEIHQHGTLSPAMCIRLPSGGILNIAHPQTVAVEVARASIVGGGR